MFSRTLFAAALAIQGGAAIDINLLDQSTIKAAAQQVANGLLVNWYTMNKTDPTSNGIFNNVAFEWWQSGGAWVAFQDYWAYTGDEQWLNLTQSAVYWQSNPDYWDFKPAWETFSEANDDQAYWTYNALTAFEYGLPPAPCPANTTGPDCPNAYVSMASNVFNQYVSRWNTTTCGGGLKWQYYPSVGGFYYKNSVTNAGFFQVAARLARYTGNDTYATWASTVWDWSKAIGYINTDNWEVYDGAGDQNEDNCTKINRDQWSYNIGSYLMGTATMYNYTGDDAWLNATQGLVDHALSLYATPPNTVNRVLYEVNCEVADTCTFDAQSFKGYLARWLAKTTILIPSLSSTIMPVLQDTAVAAAKACTGPATNVTCGRQWFIPGGDNSTSMPQQMAALEAIQAVLVGNAVQPITRLTSLPIQPA